MSLAIPYRMNIFDVTIQRSFLVERDVFAEFAWKAFGSFVVYLEEKSFKLLPICQWTSEQNTEPSCARRRDFFVGTKLSICHIEFFSPHEPIDVSSAISESCELAAEIFDSIKR